MSKNWLWSISNLKDKSDSSLATATNSCVVSCDLIWELTTLQWWVITTGINTVTDHNIFLINGDPSSQPSSAEFKMVSMCLRKPICAPPHLSEAHHHTYQLLALEIDYIFFLVDCVHSIGQEYKPTDHIIILSGGLCAYNRSWIQTNWSHNYSFWWIVCIA